MSINLGIDKYLTMSKKLLLLLFGTCVSWSLAIGQDNVKVPTAVHCVALNIYYETSAKSKAESMAVTDVVMNRVKDKKYPNNPCDVIKQARLYKSGEPIPNKCQFSWFCDGKPDVPFDNKVWQRSVEFAYEYVVKGRYHGLTEGATHYHATYVRPHWARAYKRVAVIGRHIFYKPVD